jgi:hypothetical protein
MAAGTVTPPPCAPRILCIYMHTYFPGAGTTDIEPWQVRVRDLYKTDRYRLSSDKTCPRRLEDQFELLCLCDSSNRVEITGGAAGPGADCVLLQLWVGLAPSGESKLHHLAH